MNHEHRKIRTNSFGAPQGPEYPIETGFNNTPTPPQHLNGSQMPPQYPVPYAGGTNPVKSLASNLNLNEIKNMIDRMGGVDGILNMMQKANKMMQTAQQMAPMFKLLLNSFGKAKASDSYDEDIYPIRRKRRKRRRHRSTHSRSRRRKRYSSTTYRRRRSRKR